MLVGQYNTIPTKDKKKARERKRSKSIFVRAWKKHLTFFTLASNFPWKFEAFFPPTLELISPQNGFHTGVSSPEYQMGLCYEERRGGHSCKLHARAGWWGVPRMPKQVRGTAAPPRNTLEPALTKKKNVHLSKWTNIQLSRDHNKCFWGPNCTGQRTGCWGVPEWPQDNSVLKPCYQTPEVGTDMIFVAISILLLAGAVIPWEFTA